jgi:TorA maturation chaperone TorD
VSPTATLSDGLTLRAGAHQLLALGFTYPRPDVRERLTTLARDVVGLLDALGHPGADGVGAAADALIGADLTDLEAEFNRLFSGATACPPRESAYERDLFRKQHVLADAAGFYRAFELVVPDGSRWQPDDIGVELEFCATVLRRHADALDEGWDEPAAVCEDALATFLRDHLGRWYTSFTAELERRTLHPAYAALAIAARAWLDAELAHLGIAPDRLGPRAHAVDDAAAPACPMAGPMEDPPARP